MNEAQASELQKKRKREDDCFQGLRDTHGDGVAAVVCFGINADPDAGQDARESWLREECTSANAWTSLVQLRSAYHDGDALLSNQRLEAIASQLGIEGVSAKSFVRSRLEKDEPRGVRHRRVVSTAWSALGPRTSSRSFS